MLPEKIFCCYCGRWIVKPLVRTTEHLVPKSKGGNNKPENKRPCCQHCNTWRGNMSLDDFKADVQRYISHNLHRHGYFVGDFEIMLENIDYLMHYVQTAGNKLYYVKNFIGYSRKYKYAISQDAADRIKVQ